MESSDVEPRDKIQIVSVRLLEKERNVYVNTDGYRSNLSVASERTWAKSRGDKKKTLAVLCGSWTTRRTARAWNHRYQDVAGAEINFTEQGAVEIELLPVK